MKLFTFLLLLLASTCIAQPKEIVEIASKVSLERQKKNLYHLASDEMEGRLMGSRGDTLASKFIADFFKKHGLIAPYNKSYFQAIKVYRKILSDAALTIGNKKYVNLDGWLLTMRNAKTINLAGVPIVFAGYGIGKGSYNDLANIDVKGKAVLLLQDEPKDTAGLTIFTERTTPQSIDSTILFLDNKGAAIVLVVRPTFKTDTASFRKAYKPTYQVESNESGTIPLIYISPDMANELLSPYNKTVKGLEKEILDSRTPKSFDINQTISVNSRLKLVPETAPNVIGVISGSDTSAGCIILSAHHDHDGRNGNVIYYGAVDNASGTVAIMEIAALMNEAIRKGFRPKRSIIFASYTGEEYGLLGSHFLANNPLFPIEKTWGTINIDMMGRVDTFYSGKRADSSYAYILVEDTLKRGFRTALYSANEKLGVLKLDTWYENPKYRQRRLTGSDHYPFYLKGVPFIRIDSGFSKDYHKPTDTPDKINYPLLAEQTRLAFLTTWNLANN